MSYFVKVSSKPKGRYYQIYDSSWDAAKGYRVSKCVESLGYEHQLIEKGIKDPLSHYQERCRKMNEERNCSKRNRRKERISSENRKFNIGSSLVYGFFRTINLDNILKLAALPFGHSYPIDRIFLDMVACRIVSPQSKLRSYDEVLPTIYGSHGYSLDNVYQTLDDFGSDYRRIIEDINHCLAYRYRADTSSVFFDCTNFYFEIDREDDIRRKGPSKENRKDPIIGMGLLLDRNCMPMGMKMYPGNQSEKPIQRELIEELKKSGNITGRTIVVADKGLNCARNIHQAIENGDGYIYSKSLLQSSSMDRSWIFLDNDAHPESAYRRTCDAKGDVVFKIKSVVDDYRYRYTVKDENGKAVTVEFESREKRVVYYSKELHDKKAYELNRMKAKLNDLILSKAKKEEYGVYGSYVSITSESDDLSVSINQEKFDLELECAGYNMIVTSECAEDDGRIYDVYHSLWRIEQTFRIMKTDLEARPVYLQKENRIYGHFLVCYLAVVAIRFLQFVVFRDRKVKSEDIIRYVRETEVIRIDEGNYLNVSKKTAFMDMVNSVSKGICDLRYHDDKSLKALFESPLDVKKHDI